jgi:superfamily II DNA or RNA helicase
VIDLRPYQRAAVEGSRARYVAGDRSTLVVMPTGTGKTVVFAEIARRVVERQRRALVLAHRGELLTQAIAKLHAAGVEAALEQGPARARDAPVVAASVPTMKGPRLESWARDAFGLVIVDEAHHAVADSYGAILAHFDKARVLGVTATPDRADGKGLGRVFQSVAYRYELRDAIADRWLAPIRARRVKLEVDLDAVSTTAGDLDKGELATAMKEESVVAAVADALIAEAGARPTIVFTVDVEHAQLVAAALNARRADCARAVSGKSSDDERKAAAVDLAAGVYQFACNAALWTEGFDCPVVACVALVRPTKSRGLFVQCVGRGTRLADGKADCLVLDFTGLTERHRLVSAADILADGALADDLAMLAASKMEGEAVDPIALLEEAQLEIEETRRRNVVRWVTEEVADLLGEQLALDLNDRSDAATLAQVTALKRSGVDLPDGVTRHQASALLDALARRWHYNLCTYRQARKLKQFGVAKPGALSFRAASALIDTLILEKRAGREAAAS